MPPAAAFLKLSGGTNSSANRGEQLYDVAFSCKVTFASGNSGMDGIIMRGCLTKMISATSKTRN
jgi:hypothetical protein